MKYTILDYFEQTVEHFPERTAFSDVNRSISFADLKEAAENFASFILKETPEADVTAFYMDKSVETVIGFLGSAYAGKAYTQVNLRHPEARVRDIVETVSPCVIITDREHLESLPKDLGNPVFLIEDILGGTFREEALLAAARASMIDLQPLYINFTSGSTGKPKGVVVGHRSVIDFITCFTEIFGITEEDVIANQAPFDFDVSVKDIYSGLFTGAAVHIIPTPYFMQPTMLMDFLCDRKVTVMIWAVSALCFITTMHGLDYRVPEHLRLIMFSGEVMPVKHLNRLLEHLPDVTYVNLYGPTEITCNCTYYIIDRAFEKGDRLPIGVPFPNEDVFLLDEEDHIVSGPGAKGELCVRGTALALGYYREEEKTAEAFVQNPAHSRYRDLIYRTGDIVEVEENGEMVYCTRKDNQIKFLGHRVELTEIELAMEAVPDVDRACCFFEERRNRLHAFYTGTAEVPDIIAAMEKVLPFYMIPALMDRLDKMPLNKNGKIDRKEIGKGLK